MEFTILYQDEYYVAIHKPANMLVHRTNMSNDNRFVLQELRNQLEQRIYPVHRLDRATSGVIIFGLSSDAASQLAQLFSRQETEKTYLAVARGWTEEQGTIDHPVKIAETGERKSAVTEYRTLARVELTYAADRYPSSRYSLVEVKPKTGRQHQIRQHFKHISHHLIGDTSYGKGTHNRFFREHFGINRLLLFAQSLRFEHPYTNQPICIDSTPDSEWQQLLEQLINPATIYTVFRAPRMVRIKA